jgi:hypothetical protein
MTGLNTSTHIERHVNSYLIPHGHCRVPSGHALKVIDLIVEDMKICVQGTQGIDCIVQEGRNKVSRVRRTPVHHCHSI